jgi:hypothetical protein
MIDTISTVEMHEKENMVFVVGGRFQIAFFLGLIFIGVEDASWRRSEMVSLIFFHMERRI